MSNKKVKCAMAAALAGTVLAGGCIPLQAVLYQSAVATAIEFFTDNDALFDLFEDGAVPAAE